MPRLYVNVNVGFFMSVCMSQKKYPLRGCYQELGKLPHQKLESCARRLRSALRSRVLGYAALGAVTHEKPRLAACTANAGRATLPAPGGKCQQGLPAGGSPPARPLLCNIDKLNRRTVTQVLRKIRRKDIDLFPANGYTINDVTCRTSCMCAQNIT